MTVDFRLQDHLRRKKDVQDATRLRNGDVPRKADSQPTDGPPSTQRLLALETSVANVEKALAVITEQLKHVALQTDVATIVGRLETRASAIDVAELKGRVARIPTVPTLVSIGVFISLLFAAASWALRHLPPSWLS